MKSPILFLMSIMCIAPLAAAQSYHKEAVEAFKKIGIEESEAMETLSWLTDVYGPRLTNSPQLEKATQFAAEKLKSWGMKNVGLHKWGPFGKGWELKRFALHAQSEHSYFPVIAYPKAWSPGYKKPVKGEVVILKVDSLHTLDSYKGKLKGKFVLVDKPIEAEPQWEAKASRMSNDRLLGLANSIRNPGPRGGGDQVAALARARAAYEKAQFLMNEKPLAILDQSYRGWGGQVAVSSATLPSEPGLSFFERPRPWDLDAPEPIPQLSLAREHYGRMYRAVEKGVKVELEMDLRVAFYENDLYEVNVIGEIPGQDPELKDEVVMLGAHIDSWHTGTGATDNAAGSAAMLEAVRIIQKSGLKPKRTIRIALWTGEEQGLFGSIHYVEDVLAKKIGGFWTGDTVVAKKETYDNFSAYYNLDNGTGQIRGIYLQENAQLELIFRDWFIPFLEWDAGTISAFNTGGTDHLAFDNVGLPGFQFIQDPIEYGTLTHHSNMDLYERIVPLDLKRNAVIIASFVYQTANLENKLPRKQISAPLRRE